MKTNKLLMIMAAAAIVAACRKPEPPPAAPPITVKPPPPVANQPVTSAPVPEPAPPPVAQPQPVAITPPETAFDANAAAQQQQQFNDINKILADLSSSDPAAQNRAKSAITRLTPVQRQEFEKLRRLYLGK